MPIYEYRCPKCGTEFERLLKHSERDNPQPCPKCDEKQTEKQISRTSFMLKGGGWADDGYSS
jgi:putative FmdB family regulatory protein